MAIVFHTFYLKIYNYINKHMMLIMKLTWHLVNLFILLRVIEVFSLIHINQCLYTLARGTSKKKIFLRYGLNYYRCSRGIRISSPSDPVIAVLHWETGHPAVHWVLTLDLYRVDEGGLCQVDLYVLTGVHDPRDPAPRQSPKVSYKSNN